MDTGKPPALEVVKAAERIVYREKWRIWEERAAERLMHASSLACTRLVPHSPVIYVVAVDGVVVGQIRRYVGRWITTATGRHGPGANYGSLCAATEHLARTTDPC